MRCLYCGKRLPLIRRLQSAEFCSETHRKLFNEETDQAALERLSEAHSGLTPFRPSNWAKSGDLETGAADAFGSVAILPDAAPGPLEDVASADPLPEPRVAPAAPAVEELLARLQETQPAPEAPPLPPPTPKKKIRLKSNRVQREKAVLAAISQIPYEIREIASSRLPGKPATGSWVPQADPRLASDSELTLAEVQVPSADPVPMESLVSQQASPLRTRHGTLRRWPPTIGRRLPEGLSLDSVLVAPPVEAELSELEPAAPTPLPAPEPPQPALPPPSAAPTNPQAVRLAPIRSLEATPPAAQSHSVVIHRGNPTSLTSRPATLYPERSVAFSHGMPRDGSDTSAQGEVKLRQVRPHCRHTRLQPIFVLRAKDVRKPARPKCAPAKADVRHRAGLVGLPLIAAQAQLAARSSETGFAATREFATPVRQTQREKQLRSTSRLAPLSAGLPLACATPMQAGCGPVAPETAPRQPGAGLAPARPQQCKVLRAIYLAPKSYKESHCHADQRAEVYLETALSVPAADLKPAGTGAGRRMIPLTAGVLVSSPISPRGETAHVWNPASPAIPRAHLSIDAGKRPRIPVPGRGPWSSASKVWHTAPADLKWISMVVPIVLLAMLYSALPNSHPSASTRREGGAFDVLKANLNEHMDNFKKTVSQRAGVEFVDDFRNGLSDWNGRGEWARSWAYDPSGAVHTGQLALYRPTVRLTDYSMEFLGQIEKKALSWVVRARDLENYYVLRLVITKPGPLPTAAIQRYRVTNGHEGAHVQLPLPMSVRGDTLYRVGMTIDGPQYTVTVQGQVVDSWTDDSLLSGGVGFFSAKGEQASLRWVQVSYQYDVLGRLCAYLAPYQLEGSGKQ